MHLSLVKAKKKWICAFFAVHEVILSFLISLPVFSQLAEMKKRMSTFFAWQKPDYLKGNSDLNQGMNCSCEEGF